MSLSDRPPGRSGLGAFLVRILSDRDRFFTEVAAGEGLPAKLGKEWRFRRSVIDRWLDEQMLGEDSGFGHLRDGAGPDAGAAEE